MRTLKPKGLQKRSLPFIFIMSIITLGFYDGFLYYVWAAQLNKMNEKENHSPLIYTILFVFTQGFMSLVIQVWLAKDIQRHYNNISDEKDKSTVGDLVTYLSVAYASAFIVHATQNNFGPLFIIAAFLVHRAAKLVIQRELNRLIDKIDYIRSVEETSKA